MLLWELDSVFQCQYRVYFSSLFSSNRLLEALSRSVIIYNYREPHCNADIIHTLNSQGQTDLTLIISIIKIK